MYPPVSYPYLGLLGILLAIVFALLEVGVINAAYYKLGMSHRSAVALLLLSIIGSYINVPVASIHAGKLIHDVVVSINGVSYIIPQVREVGRTIIAINIGGALIPVVLSIYLLTRVGGLLPAIVSTAIVAFIVHHFSSLVPGLGIAVPTFIPGIAAALLGALFGRDRRAAVAYVAGTMGCLIGADIMNLRNIANLHAPIASIGGAGTFDGVFVSGIVAVLLA
jgi:uncharacterized membrane protein